MRQQLRRRFESSQTMSIPKCRMSLYMDVCGYTYMSWVVRSLQRHKTAGWEVIRKLGIFTFREKEHHDSNIVQK